MKISIRCACLCAAALIVAGGACSKKAEERAEARDMSPARGDALLIGSIGDAATLLPTLASDSASFDVINLVYNGLVKYDKDLNLVGDLAESWDISKDQLEITFHIRKGVKWHDGVEFTAADVEFGYRTIIDPKVPTPYVSNYKEVASAKAVDKYTFVVRYKKPFAPGLASWGSLVCIPKHLLEGKDIMKSDLRRKPVGTGPYIFKEWKTNEKIVLEANPNYFDGRPYIDRVAFRMIPDQSAQFLELKSKGLDWIHLTPVQYQRQTNLADFLKNFNKYHYLTLQGLEDTQGRGPRDRQAGDS
jgi:peptide/nickel transport system substrate-binding protein